MHSLMSALWVFFAAGLLTVSGHAQEAEECPYPSGWKLAPQALQDLLRAHEVWVEREGWVDPSISGRANLCGADLVAADLSRADLSWADLSGANLTKAVLADANLSETNLSRANLTRADLSEADLTRADLRAADLHAAKLLKAAMFSAKLSKSNLTRADLTGADLTGADLSGADLFKTTLEFAKFTRTNLTGALYEPASAPARGHLSGMVGLETVVFGRGEHSRLVLLQKALQEAGLREFEREVTFALEKGKTGHALAGHGDDAIYDKGKLIKKDTGSVVDGTFRRIFFEWTTGYGLYYGRPILILFGLIGIMTFIYLPVVSWPWSSESESGIFRIKTMGRIERTDNGFEIADDEAAERLGVTGFDAVRYAFYFSLLSAFHIGWRDLNVGSWLTRLQSREYALRARGWVRVVSGAQSLVSVYLLAMWALTYFGRPFQ